eukprot:3509001-Alexandrium_andersonii.AAC.1
MADNSATNIRCASAAAAPEMRTVHSTSACTPGATCPLPRPGWIRAKTGRREVAKAPTRSRTVETAPS